MHGRRSHLLLLIGKDIEMNDRIRIRTKKLTVNAMLCALGVVLMTVGALIEVLDLSVAALASLLCIYAVIELGGWYPWMLWLGTSVLSLLLLPVKTPALFYTFFLGYYPMAKAWLEKKLSSVPCFLCKLGCFHVGVLGIVLVAWAFFPALLENEEGAWYAVVLYGLALLGFWLYDLALTRLITVYLVKFRRLFRIK